MNKYKPIDSSLRNETTLDSADENDMKSVKEVCNLVGITRKTLFYYDKVGLLLPTKRIGPQKQKYYGEKAIQRLCLIRVLRKIGFEIQEIKEILNNQGKAFQSISKVVEERNLRKMKQLKKQIDLFKQIANNPKPLTQYSINELLAYLGGNNEIN